MATLSEPSLVALLAASGAEVLTDPADLEFYAHDIYARGADVAAVVRPLDKHQLAKSVGAATRAGHPIIPRGGGMSYTGGLTGNRPGAVVIDLGRMNRVIAVDTANMTVMVEAGCTWDTLYRTLAPLGLRTPMWGTLSGLKATIGGGLSQNSIFWGTGRHGTAARMCSALEVVLADGSLIDVGKAHLRPYGPDMVGLFLADCGALGVKATATLRLVREGKAHGYASFAFDHAADWLVAASEIERSGIATECFGFDPYLNAIRMRRESLARDAQQLVGLMKRQGGLLKAIGEGAKILKAGRSFLDDARCSLHVLSEGRIQAAADADIAAARAIVASHGGREVENSIPKIIRANPFGPLNAILGPEGERWAPVHGHVPHDRAVDCFAAIERLFADHAAEMEALGVHYGTLIAVIGDGGCATIEPCLYWPDQRNPLIDDTVESQHLNRLPQLPANPAARALASRLKQALVDLFLAHGAGHFQIGRTYRYRDSLNRRADALLLAIKREVDPAGLMNPGVLGLE